MRRAAAATGLAGVLAATLAAARREAPSALDRSASAAAGRPFGPVADRVVGAGTDLGSVYGLAGFATVLAATGRAPAAVDVAAAGSAAWVAAQAAKDLAGRPRPYQVGVADRLVAEPHGSSWPSGHTAVAAAGALALAPHLPPRGRTVAAAAVGGVAASRLYVGVHWLTDVVAGAVIGAGTAAVTRSVLDRVRRA